MGSPVAPLRVDVLLAEWVLERLPAEQVPALAIQALGEGCDASAAAVLAALEHPTRADIEDDLPGLLREIGVSRPSPDEALKSLVNDCARRIADGELDPIRGAWAMWEFSVNEDESAQFFDQVRLFVDLASECDNPGPQVATHRADIVAEATAFLERGGLRLG